MTAEVEGVSGESAALEIVEEMLILAPSGMPHTVDKKDRGGRIEATPGRPAHYFDIVRLHVGR